MHSRLSHLEGRGPRLVDHIPVNLDVKLVNVAMIIKREKGRTQYSLFVVTNLFV